MLFCSYLTCLDDRLLCYQKPQSTERWMIQEMLQILARSFIANVKFISHYAQLNSTQVQQAHMKFVISVMWCLSTLF